MADFTSKFAKLRDDIQALKAFKRAGYDSVMMYRTQVTVIPPYVTEVYGAYTYYKTLPFSFRFRPQTKNMSGLVLGVYVDYEETTIKRVYPSSQQNDQFWFCPAMSMSQAFSSTSKTITIWATCPGSITLV